MPNGLRCTCLEVGTAGGQGPSFIITPRLQRALPGNGFFPVTCSLKGVLEKQSQILLTGGKDQLYLVVTVLGERADPSSDLCSRGT